MNKIKFPEVGIINDKDGSLMSLSIDGKEMPTTQSVNIDFGGPGTCAVVTLKFLANITSVVDKERTDTISK